MQPVSEDPYAPRRPPGQDELPCEDGEPMETERHREQMSLLIESLSLAWEERRDFYVGGNMFLYFSELQTRRNDFRGPDVFVVLDTERRERKSWVVWEEGGRAPNVVIELLSETTEAVDRGDKMRVYASVLRVPEYFLYDPVSHALEGYRLDVASRGAGPTGVRGYRRIEPDRHGDLESAQLGLGLGVRAGRFNGVEASLLRWLDREGRPLPSGAERAETERQRAETERQRAETERQRADAADARSAALAERLRAAGIDPERA